MFYSLEYSYFLYVLYTILHTTVVQGNNRCLFWESYETHKRTQFTAAESLNIKADGT
jgi:hypothetical protein